MRALVTGSSGFLGRRFVSTLEKSGWHVDGMDIREDGRARVGWDVRRELPPVCYDLVVHCAAVVGGRAVIEQEALAQAANLAIDATLFEWAAYNPPGRLLYVSSSAVYPVGLQSEGAPALREDDVDLDCPHDPDQLYGWSKLTGEILAIRARRMGVKVTVVRPFSGYASDQAETYPFRAIMERARRGDRPFDVWGNGAQVRDFIHADDVVDGALAVAAAGEDGPVNLCTGVPTMMIGLVGMMTGASGQYERGEPIEVRVNPSMPSGVASRWGDPTLMRRYYQPRLSILDGIERSLREANDREAARA